MGQYASSLSSPTVNIREITSNDVANAVAEIDPTFEVYRQCLIDHGIDGQFITTMHLDEAHVQQMFVDIGMYSSFF